MMRPNRARDSLLLVANTCKFRPAPRTKYSRNPTGNKRLLLSDDQRRRLAVKGKILGRKRLEDVGTLFTPDTVLRWHRMMVAKKWDSWASVWPNHSSSTRRRLGFR
jgi:hypothetical protein